MDTITEQNGLILKGHKDVINEFDSGYKFYLINTKGKNSYVLAIKILTDNSSIKLQYYKSGVLVNRIRYEYCGMAEGGNMLIRYTNNLKMIFVQGDSSVDNSLVLQRTSSEIKFKPLEKSKLKYDSWLPNPNIGVIDTETYFNEDTSTYQIYALGFRTNLAEKLVIYYISDDFDS